MNSTNLLEQSLHALSNTQIMRWQQASLATTPITPPTITIARQAGTPGTTVAREVAARLGWEVYDHELLEHMADAMGRQVSLLEDADERRQSWVLTVVQAWAQVPSVSESWYIRQLVDTVVRLASQGHCVIVGRGAGHILPTESTLRVRLVGRREDRIAFLAQRLGLDTAEATRQLDETDRQREEFVQHHFHQDATDPARYDLLLNASRWSVMECADAIVHALKQFQSRHEARTTG